MSSGVDLRFVLLGLAGRGEGETLRSTHKKSPLSDKRGGGDFGQLFSLSLYTEPASRSSDLFVFQPQAISKIRLLVERQCIRRAWFSVVNVAVNISPILAGQLSVAP